MGHEAQQGKVGHGLAAKVPINIRNNTCFYVAAAVLVAWWYCVDAEVLSTVWLANLQSDLSIGLVQDPRV